METTRIQDQLRRAFEGEAWHGPSLRELLADVTAAKASAKPVRGAHSIWEIVLHIAAWERAVLRRLGGEPTSLSTEEDWPPVTDSSETAWRQTLTGMADGNARLREAIGRLTEDRLTAIVPGETYSVYFMLHGLIQHDLYH